MTSDEVEALLQPARPRESANSTAPVTAAAQHDSLSAHATAPDKGPGRRIPVRFMPDEHDKIARRIFVGGLPRDVSCAALV